MGFARIRIVVSFFMIGASTVTVWAAPQEELDRPRESQPPGSMTDTESMTDTSSDNESLFDGPSVFYFTDEDGNRVAIPSLSYEELMRLIKLDRNLVDASGSHDYTLDWLSIDGVVSKDKPDRATIQIELSATVLIDGYVQIPIRFDHMAVRKQVQHIGEGDHWLIASRDNGGFVWRLKAPRNTKHRLKIEGAIQLQQVGRETRLDVTLPNAVSSRMQLTIPKRDVTADVRSGGALIETSELDGEETRLSLEALRGRLQLSWRLKSPSTPQSTDLLDVRGQIVVRFARPDECRVNAQFLVRDYRKPIESIVVRLPKGHELVSRAYTSYDVQEIDVDNDSEGLSVEVRFHQPTDGPVDIAMETKLIHRLGDLDSPIQLGRFDVVGAVRQSGEIVIVSDGPWHFTWSAGPLVQQISQPSFNVQESGTIEAAFEYFQQPSELNVRVRAKRARVHVEPQFLVRIGPDDLELTANLRYNIRGAPISRLKIEMFDWQVEDVTADTALDFGALNVDLVRPLEVGLDGPRLGEVNVQIHARKSLAPREGTFTATIPRAVAVTSSPSTVIVTPDENILFTPRSEEMPDLIPIRLPAGYAPMPDVGEAIAYRDRGVGVETRLIGDVSARPMEASVEVHSEIDVGDDGARIRQRFDYQVRYGTVTRLAARVARRPAVGLDLEATIDGQPVAGRLMTSPEENSEFQESTVTLFDLPTPKSGRFALEVAYRVPIQPLDEGAETEIEIPLSEPDVIEDSLVPILTRNELTARSKATIILNRSANTPWQLSDAEYQPASADSLVLLARDLHPTIRLMATRSPNVVSPKTTVRRALIQTWMGKTKRQDRAVFRLSTSEDRIRIGVPLGMRQSDVHVVVNNEPASHFDIGEEYVGVDIVDQSISEHLVEIVLTSESRPPPGPGTLELPYIDGAQWVRRMYWQLFLPDDEQLLYVSPEMSRQETWTWGVWDLQRTPFLTTAEIEQWIGVDSGTASISTFQANLFVTFGSVHSVPIRTARKSHVIGICSGLLLAVGLSWIYLPRSRHPAFLVGAAAVITSVCLFLPDVAMVIGQATRVGVVLVCVALSLHWTLKNRTNRWVIRGRATGATESATTDFTLEHRDRVAQDSSTHSHGHNDVPITAPGGQA